MTTMELNLRKEYLYDLIKGMDEERLSKVETYIKRLCLAKQWGLLYAKSAEEKTTKKVGFMVKEIQWSKHAEESFTEISDIRY